MSIHKLIVSRSNFRRTRPDKIKVQLQKIADAALENERSWRLTHDIVAPQPVFEGGQYRYRYVLSFENFNNNPATFDRLIAKAANPATFHRWQMQKSNSVEVPASTMSSEHSPIEDFMEAISTAELPVTVSDIETDSEEFNLDTSPHFDHFLEREAQISVLLSGVRTAIESNFMIRTHALLYGPPAGGKTSLTTAFVNMIGEENCYRIDATTSTQAGVLKDLLERGSNIKFLLIDEIEKCKEDYLRWLLGVMDERGELRVNNSKTGFIQMPLPAYVIATTNDVTKIEKLMGGAIGSRFADKIFCPRVSEDSIFKAVKRYVDMINGDERWIKPAMEYVRKYEQSDDIRRMIAVAVNGRDRLLTGEYQAILRKSVG